VTAIVGETLDAARRSLAARLLASRTGTDHWEGRLASSALSTGTAILALELSRRSGHRSGSRLRISVAAGVGWLIEHQNGDGGWGDTVRSGSNISTTAIVWAALSASDSDGARVKEAIARAEAWLGRAAGSTEPDALRNAILRRYGKDRTFSVPILTVLALSGKLGTDPAAAWRSVPQLPFELASLPHHWFQHLRLPVVSYALPALIAIGQVRHFFAPTRNPIARRLRDAVRSRTHAVLREMQPDSGGYLEATPLTSFVVMSLAAMDRVDSPVVENGVRFLVDSVRSDGSWPIDTNLATWVTTLSIGALSESRSLPADAAVGMKAWLLRQQSRREHPFTHAAPGAWAWTPLSGGVPDADDTSGALVALRLLGRLLGDADASTLSAAAAGAKWLLGVQNGDGGIPTFCRGWGALPFDRSTPEITAHALQAWSAWHSTFDEGLGRAVRGGAHRAADYLRASQRSDGSWIPLWFGNEHAPHEDNPVYGTARALRGLQAPLVRDLPHAAESRRRAVAWLLGAQNVDGGWGGNRGVASSVEETGVALAALGPLGPLDHCAAHGGIDPPQLAASVTRGACWLMEHTVDPPLASPVGLYFARLWYFEELYPLIFALEGLAAARAVVKA
jgi:squalene-hopene/tetraprenyl-beta-curcumene cyclase